jgi:GTP cyclohydrolase II
LGVETVRFMKEPSMSFEEEIRNYSIIEKVMDVPLRNQHGEFLVAAFLISAFGSKMEPMALYRGLQSIKPNTPVPVRIDSGCLTGEVFGCDRCDCKWQLDQSLRYIVSAGVGLLIYHPEHEGRGFGLVTKLRSYQLMDKGLSTAQAFRSLGVQGDARRFFSSVLILREFGITRVNLLTNNPQKVQVLQALGIVVEKVTPLIMPTPNARLRQYLRSKRDEMGHMIPGGV